MSPDERIAALAAKQHGAFAHEQAVGAEFTASTIKYRRTTGRWRDLHRGVYAIAGAPATYEQRVMAVTLAFGPPTVAASITAAWLHDLVERPGDRVFVILPAGQHRQPRPGIALMQADLSRTDVRTVSGIPVTAPNRTLVDLAGVLTERALEAALDDAIQLGLTTVPRLKRYIRERRLEHRPGVKTLRRLLDERTKGVTQKEMERLFLRKLRASGLPEPVRQHPCGELFIDIAYPAQRIAIELDGRSAHFSGRAFRADPRRRNQIVLAGWTLYLFTWEDVDDLWPDTEAVLRRAIDSA